ncbi:beta-1,3-galactosyltransferase 2-like [Gastrophryne carolinensis]
MSAGPKGKDGKQVSKKWDDLKTVVWRKIDVRHAAGLQTGGELPKTLEFSHAGERVVGMLHQVTYQGVLETLDTDWWHISTSYSMTRRTQNLDLSQQAAEVTTPYKYSINEPKKCLTSNPFLILLIVVQAWQKEARQAIRQTWGKEDFLPGVKVLRLFLLGKDVKRNERVEQYITEESRQYHDIIQQDFLDTYNNLPLKTLMGLHWVATYCPHALYVMKTDSDMFINTEYLVYKVLKPDQPPRTNYFTGYLMRGYLPNRNKESKWYMSEELYPSDQYPPFCSGTGYVFSGDLAAKIQKISANITILHLEDVFVGLCLNKIGVSPVPPPKDSDFNHWKISYSPCSYNSLVTTHQLEPSEIIRYWNDLHQNKDSCGRSLLMKEEGRWINYDQDTSKHFPNSDTLAQNSDNKNWTKNVQDGALVQLTSPTITDITAALAARGGLDERLTETTRRLTSEPTELIEKMISGWSWSSRDVEETQRVSANFPSFF